MVTGNTSYENEDFELYQDQSGRFWLWDKKEKVNHAIRASSEIDAYRQAISSLIFLSQIRKQCRDDLQEKLNTLRTAYETVFIQEEGN